MVVSNDRLCCLYRHINLGQWLNLRLSEQGNLSAYTFIYEKYKHTEFLSLQKLANDCVVIRLKLVFSCAWAYLEQGCTIHKFRWLIIWPVRGHIKVEAFSAKQAIGFVWTIWSKPQNNLISWM